MIHVFREWVIAHSHEFSVPGLYKKKILVGKWPAGFISLTLSSSVFPRMQISLYIFLVSLGRYTKGEIASRLNESAI